MRTIRTYFNQQGVTGIFCPFLRRMRSTYQLTMTVLKLPTDRAFQCSLLEERRNESIHVASI